MKTLKKSVVFALCAASAITMSACSNKPEKFNGVAEIVDKHYTPAYTQMITTANNIQVPVYHDQEYYITVCIDPSDDKSCWSENVNSSFYNDADVEMILEYTNGDFKIKKR